MKGRKGKKGNKAAPKNLATTQDRQPQPQSQQPTAMNANHSQSQGTQSEDFYEDDYDDDYAQDDPPPPSPVVPPVTRRVEAVHQDQGKHPIFHGGVGINHGVVA
jgi:hypothetical protein